MIYQQSIIGCDSGFGNRLAYKLNQNGFRVYATVLSATNEGSKQLVRSAVFEDKMHVLEMDVTNDDNVRQVYEKVRNDLNSNGDQLWAVVNNAGMFSFSHIEWGTIDKYKQVFEVNVFGMVRVTRTFLSLIKESKGRIVNVVSLAGRFTFENGGVYCMSKHSAIAFSDQLRREMHKFDIKVLTIEPGLFRTPMTSDSYMQNLVKQAWDQTDESVRNSYGKSYFEKHLESVLDFHKNFKSGSNTEIVINDIIDALQNTDPNITYRPIEGLQSKILSLIPMFIPSEWLDQIIYSRDKLKPEGIHK